MQEIKRIKHNTLLDVNLIKKLKEYQQKEGIKLYKIHENALNMYFDKIENEE